MRSLFVVSVLVFANTCFASPLMPVKLDSPRATFKTYMDAMNDYVEGVRKNDKELMRRIDDAVRCFDLSDEPFGVIQMQEGRTAAKLLKEVIDRVVDPYLCTIFMETLVLTGVKLSAS